MINSKSKKLKKVVIPEYSEDKELSMLPINLAGGNILPDEFKKYLPLVKKMIKESPVKEGVAYLTIHEKIVEVNKTHRRGGTHIDGNYIPINTSGWNDNTGWGTTTLGGWNSSTYGGGWKVGNNGAEMSSEGHIQSYQSDNGGMLITSNYSLCKGYNGKFKGVVKQGGDCSHLDLSKSKQFMLKPNTIYLTNSQFVHESIPTDKTIKRVLVRITLPSNFKVLN